MKKHLLLAVLLLGSISLRAASYYSCVTNAAMTALTSGATSMDLTVTTKISQAYMVALNCYGPNTTGFRYAIQDVRYSTSAPCNDCYPGHVATSATAQAWINLEPWDRLWVIADVGGTNSATIPLGIFIVDSVPDGSGK
jgi:hypothetical protein